MLSTHVTCNGRLEGLGTIRLFENYNKRLSSLDCVVDAHWMCIFDHSLFFHPKSQWNNFFCTTLIWMPSIYPRVKLHSMKCGSLVKSSKNMKIWEMPIISRLTFSMVGTFHSLTKLFFSFKSKDSAWKPLQLYKVKKKQHFTWELGNYVIATPSSHLVPALKCFGQMLIKG